MTSTDKPQRPLGFEAGGQSSGAAYPNEAAPEGDAKFEGGQSRRDYHGSRTGGSKNEAVGCERENPEDKEKTHGGL